MEPIQQDNETISLKKIIVYYLLHWKVFVVAGLVSLVFAVLYLVFVPRTYEMMARVQLLEDKGTSGSGFNMGDASGLMKTFGLGGISGGSLNLDDEMAKFMSTTTLKEVVLRLGLNAPCYKPYEYDYKMYDEAPLVLTADWETQETLVESVEFKVRIDDNGRMRVKTKSKIGKHNLDFQSLPADIHLPEGTFTLSYRSEAVKPLSLKMEYTPAINVAEALSESILYDEYSKNANVIELSCTDYERKRGLDLLNTLIDVYNSWEDSVKREKNLESVRFLDDRLAHVTSDLSDIEEKIEKYKLKNKMTDIEHDVEFYVEQMKELQVKIIELEAQGRLTDLLDAYVKDPKNKYNLVPGVLSTTESDGASSSVMAYNQALLERERLLQSTKADNPLVAQLNKQVDQLRKNVHLSIENAKKTLSMTLDDLRGKEKQILDKMGEVPTLEREYIDFRRQQEICQALYLILLQKREDLMISIGDSKDRVRIVEQPYVKAKAVAPRKLFALIGMMIFTLVGGVGYLFGKEQWGELKKELEKARS